MVASYQEFAAEHRGEHLTPVNRWCAVFGNYSTVPAAVALLSGRPKRAAGIFALGTAILLVGHAVEGNQPRNIRYFVRHPIWSTRADFTLASATVKDAISAR